MRIAHVTIVHKPGDQRIFRKQCRTLAAAGYDVHLVTRGSVPAGDHGVTGHSLGEDRVRPSLRGQVVPWLRALRRIVSLRPSVVHLHEPHLVPLGVVAKLLGARVVYDVHEDNPAHARTKLHDRRVRKHVKAGMWAVVESVARRTFDAFVCASPQLAEKFPPQRTIVVGNFPQHREFEANGTRYHQRAPRAIYNGVISRIRGFVEMIEAVQRIPGEPSFSLRLVGRFRPPSLERELWSLRLPDHVELEPWLDYPEMVAELMDARVGLILLHPLPNHQDPLRSNKLFEYMAAGVPVIASDLPRWRELVVGLRCGLVVDPQDPRAIADALDYLMTNPDKAAEMGERGRAAVESTFNWDGEGERLLELYARMRGDPSSPAPAVETGLTAA
jgi:glycosyltransferase involved in cell wall biosynthesis